MMIKPSVFDGLGLNREPQIIECRITNYEGWNRFAKSILNRQNTFIRRSMLNVRCSTFISFVYDQTGRFSGKAALNTDTRNLKPKKEHK
jgi:hypothetical protein